uniref:SUI1 domain-containing protein n=1 Tax=Clytia hemisphaerica TaxID=252671 RepID=A0A7M5TQ24_9CNID|eukprot:TCONS_00003043-protein
MPKKKKNEEQKDPHEGRPNHLTFGDFLVLKKTAGKDKTDTEAKISDETATNSNQGACALPADTIESTPVYVCRTKKGGIPVKVENRSSGKKVTIIEHVLGNNKVILQELKTKLGTGGVNHGDFIELQGDCKTKVTKYLNDNKHLLKPYGTKL